MEKYRGETERREAGRWRSIGERQKGGRHDDEEVSGRDRKEGGTTMKKYRGETERREVSPEARR